MEGGDGPQPGPAIPPVQPRQVGKEYALKPDIETSAFLRILRDQIVRKIEKEIENVQDLERRAKEARERVRQRKILLKRAHKHAQRMHKLAGELGLKLDRPVTPVPPVPAGGDEEEFITIEPERVFLRIYREASSGLYFYQVIEPPLEETEREAYDFIHGVLVRALEAKPAGHAAGWAEYLAEATERIVLDYSVLVDDIAMDRIKYRVLRDFLGYGPINPIMLDPMIEDISCDGPKIPIYLFHREYQSVKSNVVFENEEELDRFVMRLAQVAGKAITIADPFLDATLPEGNRLQASLSREVTTRGSSFTIRKYRTDPLTPPDLVRLGTLTPEMAALMWIAFEGGRSMIMAGGTASGKTTTLNAISLFIPPHKKIVSIEDTREISLPHENWIAGLTRKGFVGQGASQIDMFRLLESALRQRPEYLIVGEVRGQEAMTLFQAMATGHATYSTMHADSIQSAVYRLENPPINVPRIMLQNLDAVGVQVVTRDANHVVRRMTEFVEVIGVDPGTGDLLTSMVFEWDPQKGRHSFMGRSHILEAVGVLKNLSEEEMIAEWKRRTQVIDWMVQKGVRHVNDVWPVITTYYSDPDRVMSKVRLAVGAR